MMRGRLLIAVLMGFAFLGGCNTPPPEQKLPDLAYAQLPPIRLNVRAVEVIWSYEPPYKAPNVDHLFTTPPGRAAERWANDRLKPEGTEGLARFIIRNASVIQTRLKTTSGVPGLFKNEQSDRYDGVLEVELRAQDDAGRKDAVVTARATVSQTVAENTTLNELEKTWFGMTETLMRELNKQLESNIQAHLGAFLIAR
ncbi:MAG: hypothetical protein U1F33_16295 [Alphaproteobacteria bacterium]